MEPRLHQRLQKHGCRRLRNPVSDRWHAEHPGPRAVRLGDLHRPDRGRKERPRTHPIPDLVEVVRKLGLELIQLLPIHSRRTLVGLDLPPRLPDQQLGNLKRLLSGFGMLIFASSRSLTAPVERTDIPGEPAPSLHPHPRSAGASQLLRAGPPASAATGTQCLRFPPLAHSLSPPVELTRRPGRPLSTLAFSRSVQEPQTRLTPPSRRAPPGQ